MRNFSKLFLLCVGIFIFNALSVEAAALYIDPPRSELFRGDAIELSIRLDTDEASGECINAVDAVIKYSANIVPVDVSIGDSIFSIWVEQPVINAENRTITFAGGIPNGYCGRVDGDPRLTNTLAKIIFRSPGFSIGGVSGSADEKTARVEFSDKTTAFLNDGQGTQVPLRVFGAEMYLEDRAGTSVKDPWRTSVGNDEIPPEEFSIFLEKDTKAFGGKYYIAFNTTDKQTGIDQYQIMEQLLTEFGSFAWGRMDAPWIVDRSPYVLDDQSLNSIIRVKAIDKAGNEYISTLIPDESLRTITEFRTVVYIAGITFGILILFGFGIGLLFYRKKKKSTLETAKKEETEEEGDYKENE